jgi:hypothetical protein
MLFIQASFELMCKTIGRNGVEHILIDPLIKKKDSDPE